MLQKIEADKRRPSPPMAESLARTLGLPSDQRAAFVEFARSGRRAMVGASFHPPSNLPAPPTPLIGRERDVAAVRQRLLREDTRLLTLVGPPGIGKTRLALKVAADVRDCFDDGVFFVPLAPITNPDLVAPTILQALGLKESGRQSPVDHLSDYVRDKLMLLVLDNLEQVIAAAPMIARLLAACPLLNILATSRIALRVRAERQFPIPPLALPDLARLPSPEWLDRYSAIALFLDRAQAVAPDFVITETNASAVAHICHRLDGLPLAIELIAARVKIMSPAELLARLGGKLLLRSDGLRDIDERQRTLQNAIEWSYNLLPPQEQTLLARLAVFVGGWTLDAAECVCGDPELLSSAPVHDLLTLLLNKSLLVRQMRDDGPRLSMLEMVREYALERLDASGAVEATRRRHAEYWLALAERVEPNLSGREPTAWLDQLERDHDNFCAALGWAFDHEEIQIAARLCNALWRFWYAHGHFGEARRWLAQVLDAPSSNVLTGSARASLLYAAGFLARVQADFAQAAPLLQECLRLRRYSGTKPAWSQCSTTWGASHWNAMITREPKHSLKKAWH
jgi:predicted ATPase